MGWIGILHIVGMIIVTSGLTIGEYILQRDKYWMRIWEDMGRPYVKSIKELKSYIDNQKSAELFPKSGQGSVKFEKR